MLFLDILILVISLLILSKSSSFVVDHVSKISSYFGVSQVAIGFLLLSVSTSLPELSVSFISSSLGEGAIAAGNVFGSNIANIFLVLGLGAFLYGLKMEKNVLADVGLILVLTTVISAYIILGSYTNNTALGFLEGLILILIFILYIYYTLRKKKVPHDGNESVSKKEALSSFLKFAVGVIVVLLSSRFVVNSSLDLARQFNIAESFIGATLIAIGTSLPELSIDLQAIRKKHYGLALGDAIGSNMTNLTLVLGTAGLINSIAVNLSVFIAALLFAVVANILLLYLAAVDRRISKLHGALFLVSYLIYLAVILNLQISELAQTP